LGIFTLGDAPNAPVTATDRFAVADPDEEAPDDELEDEEPQPATAVAASSGIMSSAYARRMATSLGALA
jgi:hypothetical protein